MKQYRHTALPSILYLVGSCAMLSACGGGGDDDTISSTQASPTATTGSAPSAAYGSIEALGRETATAPNLVLRQGAAEGPSPETTIGSTLSIAAPADTTRRTIQSASTAIGTAVSFSPSFTGRAYYVHSASGNDANPGTVDLPWRSLQRASQAVLNSGDALLLSCDGTWTETVTFGKSFAPAGQVLIGAYGSCASGRRPVINGATPVPSSAWQLSSSSAAGNVYTTQIVAPVAGVFQSSKPLLKARYPNFTSLSTNYSVSLAGTAATKLVVSASDKATLSGRDLSGAALAIRSAPYMIEPGEVSAYDSATGSVTLKAATKAILTAGAGYFFEGKRWMLDAPDEWLHEPSSNTLSIFLAPGNSPANATIEFTQPRSTVIVSGITGVRIENLTITNAGDDGLQVVESGGARVTSVQVSNARSNGINVFSTTGIAKAQGVIIENCVITGSGISGIGSAVTDTQILRNTVTDTGTTVLGALRPTAGIRLSQIKNTVVSGNDVRRSGYSGILFGNRENITIQDNHIEDSCLVLTDCGGIYSWGASAGTTRSTIAYNHILRTSVTNLNGAGSTSSGGALELVAGIYLDEGSDNLDLTSNFIDDANVGINLHKAKNNTIKFNQIYGIREAGLRAQSTGTDSLSVIGNRVEDNVMYAPSYFVMGTNGLPGSVGGTPQLWIHQTNALSMFSGTNKNIVARNTMIHLSGDTSPRWLLRSAGVDQAYNDKTWPSTVAPTDVVKMPFRARVVTVTGTQLLSNPTMTSPDTAWSSYSYTSGAKITQFGALASCAVSCASLTSSTANDVLQQTAIKASTTGPDLMFVRYRVHAGTKTTSAKLEVRGDAAPYPSAGYLETATEIAPNGQMVREAFFLRTLKTDLRVSIKSAVGAPLMIDSVELFQVSSVQTPSSLGYGRLLTNQGTQAASLSCASLGLSTCEVVNEAGVTLSWPIAVPARSARMIFIKDPTWLQY